MFKFSARCLTLPVELMESSTSSVPLWSELVQPLSSQNKGSKKAKECVRMGQFFRAKIGQKYQEPEWFFSVLRACWWLIAVGLLNDNDEVEFPVSSNKPDFSVLSVALGSDSSLSLSWLCVNFFRMPCNQCGHLTLMLSLFPSFLPACCFHSVVLVFAIHFTFCIYASHGRW